MAFNEEYSKIKELVKDDLYQIENNLIDFYCGDEDLQKNILEIIKAPSKRLRPVLGLLYLKMYGISQLSMQIDVVTIVGEPGNFEITHYENAVTPKLLHRHR